MGPSTREGERPAETIVSRTRKLGERVTFDQQLMLASGRWDPGNADPTPYLPGDIVAVRSILGLASLSDVGHLNRVRTHR